MTSAPSFKTPNLPVDPQTTVEVATDLGEPDIDSTAPHGGESKVGNDDAPGKKTPRALIADHDARTAIIASAVEAATTAAVRRRLYGRKPIVVVVQVPSNSWVKPLEDFLQTVAEVQFSTFARTGSIRTRDRPGVNNDEVAERVSRGRRVVGIAVDPVAILPTTLVAAADFTVKVEHPTAAVICSAIKRCLHGPVPKNVGDDIAAGLSLDDMVASMRFGSSPAQAIERMRSAAARLAGTTTSGNAPLLETAVEYGAARDWGLSLARDIKDYRAGKIPWSQCPKGVVFHSLDPGCGKSLLIDSIGHHAGLPVVRASVGEFFATSSGDLGAVLKAQREVFARAAVLAPCLLFLDEIDGVPNRATLSPRGADWWLPIINDLLMLLDSAIAGQREGIVVIGATNRIKGVDAALLRPGRLEQAIEIVRPNLAGVINILRFHLGASLKDADITDVTRFAEGATPAELMAMVRTARRTARHAERDLLLDDLHAQVASAEVMTSEKLRRISVHESAHAVTIVELGVGEIDHVLLRSHGTSGGHTKAVPKNDDLPTLDGVESRVISILAAGVAEELIIGDMSAGSGGSDTSDLAVATGLLSVIHASTNLTGDLFFHGNTEEAAEIVRSDPGLRRAVQRHLEKLEERARELVWERRNAILAVAGELAARRYLSGDDVAAIIAASDARVLAPVATLDTAPSKS